MAANRELREQGAGISLDDLPPATAKPDAATARRSLRGAEYPVVDLMVQGEAIAQRESRIAELEAENAALKTQEIPLALIDPNPHQPRTHIDPETLDDLVASIEQVELMQPVVLRPGKNGRYILVGGSRRLLAYQRLKRETIPAKIKQYTEAQAAFASAAENLAREDLSDYEKYAFFQHLMDEGFAKSQRELAEHVGKSRAHIVFLFAFGRLPPASLALLNKSPQVRLGSGAARQFATWHESGHTALVEQAIQMLVDRTLTTQESALEWVRKRLRKPVQTSTRAFAGSGGRPVFSLRQASHEITVRLAKDLDPVVLKAVADKLAEHLEEAAGSARESD